MVKKLFILLLMLTLALGLFSCADNNSPLPNENTPNVNNNQQKPAWGGPLSSEFASAMKKGVYYMKYTGYSMGMEMEGIQVVLDDNIDTATSVMGFDTRTILLDDIAYMIDNTNKTYYVMPDINDSVDDLAESYDYDDMYYVGDGKGSIPGLDALDTAEYAYEEYYVDIDDTLQHITIRFYFKADNSLYAIYTSAIDADLTMVIEEFSTKIPQGTYFSLPEGYEKVAAPY